MGAVGASLGGQLGQDAGYAHPHVVVVVGGRSVSLVLTCLTRQRGDGQRERDRST